MLDWLPLEWLQSGIWLELLELMRHGGVMIVPIGICSLITVLVIIERWMMLRSGRVLPKKLLFELREQVEIRPRKISNLKPSDTHPVGRILLHGMTVLPCTPSHFKESLQDQARREKHVLEKGLVSLEVIAGVAPLASTQTKRLVSRIDFPGDLEAHLRDELVLAARGLKSRDGREAVRAIREKRKPVFTGQ